MLDVLKGTIAAATAPGEMFEITEVEVRGQTLRNWANAPATLRDMWLGTTVHANKDYLVYQDERWTYADAHQQVASVANWLVSNGIKQHDRVAIAMRNYPEWMLAYWAVVCIGAVPVGINAWWVAEELKYGLKDSDVKLLICDKERLARFSEVRDEFSNMPVVTVRMDDTPSDTTAWATILETEPLMPDASIDPDDDVCIFYTSGTTGFPKGAQLTHRSCVAQLVSALFANVTQLAAIAIVNGKEPPNPMAEDATPPSSIVVTPLFHVTANNSLAQSFTMAGGKLVHMYKWDAGEALRIIEEEKIGAFTGVPTMSRELFNHPDFAQRDISSLIYVAGGGAAVQPDLIDTIDKNGGGAVPAQGYGLTETCGVAAGSYGVYLTSKPNSAGLILPVLEMKCIDEQGNDLPQGETGEILIRGPHVIKGYLNRPDATAETIVDGWLHTGDIGFIDEDDFVYLVDRAKDMVLRGGENIYCSEVEVCLYKYSGVAECTVFSVPDERLGEEVGAAIFPAPGATIDVADLRAFMKSKLAAFKVPRYIWVLDEPLPRNASGKFVKRELQDSLDVATAS